MTRPTREECIQAMVQRVVDSIALQATRTPRAAAKAAWYPSHRLTVDQIEDLIRERRGLPAIDRGPVA